jgi:hypothetical protein
MGHDLTLQRGEQLGCRSRSGKFRIHPLHSPDIAPSDFYLFEPFKNFLLEEN